MEAGLPFRSHPGVLTIRYEDLVRDYQTTAGHLCDFLEEDFAEEMLDWYTHARVRSSRNLIGRDVRPMHERSIRKFDAPGFKHRHLVEELLETPAAQSLLTEYGFL